MISVILVSFNAGATLRACLTALFAHAAGAEVILVDNGSSDETIEIARDFIPRGLILIRAPRNLGFGAANNLGVRRARGAFLYLQNTDAYLPENCLPALMRALADHPDLAAVGPRLVYPDGAAQPSAFGFSTPRKWLLQILRAERGLAPLLRRPRLRPLLLRLPMVRDYTAARASLPPHSLIPTDWLCGASLLIRKEDFLAIGGFDPAIFLYSEDEDLCRRVRAKGRGVALCVTDPPLVHDHGWRQGAKRRRVSKIKFASKQVFIDKHFTGGARLAMHGLLYAKRWLNVD